MSTGRFITFEGIEGVGKSTNIVYISKWLENAGVPVLRTREPGGTRVGEEIREILLQHRSESIDPNVELLLFFAARAQHLQHVILPALQKGHWVLCDRFTDTSYAYQGAGRGIPEERIAVLENWVQGDLRPDLTLIFDVPAELGLQRARGRGKSDRIESEQVSFFKRVRDGYLERARKNPHRYHILDASQSLVDVQAQMVQLFSQMLDAVT